MSSEWAVQRLDQIAEINPTRKVHKGSAVPFVDMAALPQFSRDISVNDVVVREAKGAGAHFQNGDTLLARITPCLENGKTAQVRCLDGDAIAEGSTEFIVLCGKDPADNDYIYYLCREPAFREYAIGRMEGTSGRQRVSWQSIAAYQFAFPSPEERRETARVLSTLDDRITLLRETNATLEAIAQALFKSWFVDFDPVRAKMEGCVPEGMDDATAALFPDVLEETELGPVPKGWRYSTIGESFILTMGQSPPGDTYNEAGDGLPFYQGRTDFGFRFPSQRVFCTAPTRLAEPGDTLVSVRAPVGDVNMALEKCCVGRGVAAVRHPNGCRSFAFYATRGLRSRFDLFDSEGTVFGSINKKDFQALPVIEPSGDVLVAFDEIAAPIDRRIVGNEEQIRTLATLRDTLLPRLISGQLRVPEASEATLA